MQDARALVQGQGPQGSDALRLRGGGLPDSALQQLLRLRGGAGDAGAKAGTPGKAGISAEAAAIAAEAAAAAAAAGAEVADGGAPGSSSKQAVKRPRKSAEEKAAAAAAAAAAGKHKFKVGEAVEVMNNEEGLMGCWWVAGPSAGGTGQAGLLQGSAYCSAVTRSRGATCGIAVAAGQTA
jgi:hypothetical protein